MASGKFAVFAVFMVVVSIGVIGLADGEAPSAEVLLQRAAEAWQLHRDPNAALDLYDQAVAAAPGDGKVLIRRAMFLESLSGLVTDEETAIQLRDAARDDYAEIASSAPEGPMGGIARDGLNRIDGRHLFPTTVVECPTEANEAFHYAEQLFGSGKYDEAIASYATAAGACPESAQVMVAYADAYYSTKRFEDAAELFEKAVALDPWSRTGHRYLADTYARLGKFDQAVYEAARAVASDPTYEAAWGTLRSFATGLGGSFGRVYGRGAEVFVEEPGADGESNIVVQLESLGGGDDDEGESDDEGEGVDDESGDVSQDQVCWVMYGITKAGAVTGSAFTTDDAGELVETDTSSWSPFEIERHAVTFTLKTFEDDGEPGFWAMMARARDAGYLDEAVFLHLMDEDLVEEYLEYRDGHADAIMTYLATVVVQFPEPEE